MGRYLAAVAHVDEVVDRALLARGVARPDDLAALRRGGVEGGGREGGGGGRGKEGGGKEERGQGAVLGWAEPPI